MAPQSVAHRRGGTHKVRDQDKTDSIYDTYNYKQLLDTAKERGIYRKDMKKAEMAFALKHHDEERTKAEREAVIVRQRLQQQARKEQQRRLHAKQKRRVENERGRERDEDVSDDTMSEKEMEANQKTRDEYKRDTVGQVLSDESWESTSTESSTRSGNRPIEADCKLRLFEWPYEDMPLLNAPSWLTDVAFDPENLPQQVAYVPLKVITTGSKQTLFLPGNKYPTDVYPDYVPILSLQTRKAARNGIMEGVLRKATIERATDWATRTQVQGWNARMYFNLPSRNEAKDLAETYQKWLIENRKLLRVKGRGDGVSADRKRRHAQRERNKGRKTAEVYESSKWRLPAVCYISAYLDFGLQEWKREEWRKLDNLFFIRFPGCDVPHYYFWTQEGEWDDPTARNEAWDFTHAERVLAVENEGISSSEDGPSVGGKYARKSWKPETRNWIRVKKPDILPPFSLPPSEPNSPPPSPTSSTPSTTLAAPQRYQSY
ncbi:hypothetical protein EJ02DRAFT_494726 [Clathrospora elynae]|uniref:Uncharacterized protein n=1 Tax=Clathrospora elynae TaxID=706981 RepID=A0A6A5SLG7_9PLEO|nr:hypothetical protein EJ02DRAFT_494726 [Clathrospora elynae]